MTAGDIIKRSLRLLGVYAKSEEPSSDEMAGALMVLNGLLAMLSNTAMVFAKTLDVIPLTAGVQSITVGPTNAMVRPIKVLDDSYVSNGTVSYPLRIFTEGQYSAIPVKTTQGIPESLWPLMNMPDAQLTLYPVPIAGLTLNLWSIKALQSFPSLTTATSLPPGYEDALPPLLAESLAPEYQLPISPDLRLLVDRARRNIETMNFQAPMLALPVFRPYNVQTNR